MKAKINELGRLCIERCGVFKEMSCIRAEHFCDHMCSHFGEPEGPFEGLYNLSLCNRVLELEELEDLRVPRIQ